jgi:carboxypeptidase C (cathepsin A)
LRDEPGKNPPAFSRGEYQDLATPYFAASYSIDQLHLPPKYRSQISFATFDTGHMVYLPIDGLKKLKSGHAMFIDEATAR